MSSKDKNKTRRDEYDEKLKKYGRSIEDEKDKEVKEMIGDDELVNSLMRYADENNVSLSPAELEAVKNEAKTIKDLLSSYISDGGKEDFYKVIRLLKSHALLSAYKSLIFAPPDKLPYMSVKILETINRAERDAKDLEIRKQIADLKAEELKLKLNHNKELNPDEIASKLNEISNLLENKAQKNKKSRK